MWKLLDNVTDAIGCMLILFFVVFVIGAFVMALSY